MSWNKFRQLARPVPFPPAASSRDMNHSVTALPQGPLALRPPPAQGDAGPGLVAPATVSTYIMQARTRLKSPKVSADFWLPDHIRTLTKGRNVNDAAKVLVGELLKNPRGDALVEARALLNELGRDPESAAAVRAVLTPEALAQAFSQGRK